MTFSHQGLGQTHSTQPYAYGSPVFTGLIKDSYSETAAKEVQPFYDWMLKAYAKMSAVKLRDHSGLSLNGALKIRKLELAKLKNPEQRAKLELQTGAWLHRMVKATIPYFSLERGFEFSNTVTKGERQCLLQSVLIAGMLQEMGIDAGVYMVWKNSHGQVSNLGHVSAVIKLSDGRDVLVDASEKEPFFEHQGLFGLVKGQYRFLEPKYTPDSTIRAYRVLKGNQIVKPNQVKLLNTAYVRSLFYYYRGERVPGGFMGNPRTTDGLAASARFLQRAIQLAPQNPLAQYVLGHVYRQQGRMAQATQQYKLGYGLYRVQGFIPDGPKEAYGWASLQ